MLRILLLGPQNVGKTKNQNNWIINLFLPGLGTFVMIIHDTTIWTLYILADVLVADDFF